MNSIGILYKIRQGCTPRENVGINADLHVNYWKLPIKGGNYDRFIDFGVMVYEVGNDIDELYFYFPFEVLEADLEDLGKSLSQKDLLCLLFGADYELRNGISTSYTYADTKTEGKLSFWMYQLDKPNFEIVKKQSGTIVKVKIKTHPNNETVIKEGNYKKDSQKYNLYIRFRVNNITDKNLYNSETLSNDFIQSAFSKTEMTDIYINDKRSFDKSDYQDLSNMGTFFTFSKFHFFFVGSSCEETVSGQTTYKDCRPISYADWAEYLGGHNPQKLMCIAYHWNVDVQNAGCKVFLRTVYSSKDIYRIIKYSFYVFGMSFLATLVYDLIKILLSSFMDSINRL
ncbi:MAG: hypothetical protein NC344_00015 [Bacteroidales bacterium]|nr:hypothetical protein [Bacteroidales bacterium]MCM1146221.1 hypothetical protein [Bacteroidales bacterium]MCM1205341.1 hypothetical protein [Bacillota bacterium]MCM1509572.1 hypothetical protein [Clostridium sp.]